VAAALIGTALGALTSSAILPSPAVSILGLIGGYLALVLVSGSAVGHYAVPVLGWMRAARDSAPLSELPRLALPAVLWPAVALLVYARLRRTRP
jgi:CDP-diglyceride synthetase